MTERELPYSCKWCGSLLGVLHEVNVTICPICDYAVGNAGPGVQERIKGEDK
jgi:hypothetical protein